MSRDRYHHGALREALLDAAETALERDGPGEVTLRSVARAVDVSHAAPAHHFGDLAGLMSELAAVGFRRFAGALSEGAAAAGSGPRDRLDALGRAYVGFARAHPALFRLMFSGDRLDRERPALRDAARAAFALLRDTVEAGGAAGDGEARAVAAWSTVHGFALLMLDGRLPRGRTADELLDAVLAR